MAINFGAPTSAPANSSFTGGFTFGANTSNLGTPQPSLFGTPASTAPAFGTTPTFGATQTPAFGATSSAGFGAMSTPGFGATSTPAFGGGLGGTGLSFGAGSNTTTTSTGLGFGAPISSATTGGLNFGAPASTAAPGLGGFSFGPPASTSAPSLGFGMLGSTATTAGSSSLFDPQHTSLYPIQEMSQEHIPSIPITQTFQMFPHFKQQTSRPSNNLNHGLACRPKNTHMLHVLTPTRDSYHYISSSFGAKPGITATSTQPSTSASVGLGGLATASAGMAGTSDTMGTGKGTLEQQPKQNKLPNEISTTVDSFNEFVKRQKSLGADVMRVSIKPLIKVSRQAEETIRAALALSGEAGRARSHSRRLREAAARALAAAERAGRDPPGMDSEGLAPPAYVLELIGELESQLLTFRRQMDIADRQMAAPHRLLTEQELSLGMRRMHESLVALAGRLQIVHAQVQEQKNKYLNLRRHLLKDTTDIFDSTGEGSLESLLREVEGSRKKKSPGGTDSNLSAVLSDPRAALGSMQQATGPTPFTYLGSSLTNFPAADISVGASWGQPQPAPPSFGASFNNASTFGTLGTAEPSSSFQLQKPPKRGKQ